MKRGDEKRTKTRYFSILYDILKNMFFSFSFNLILSPSDARIYSVDFARLTLDDFSADRFA